MSNSVKGEVPLVLGDGREYLLVLDHEAMLSIEDETGKPLPVVMARAGQGFMTAVVSIAQAAFARHHPEVTRGEVSALVFSEELPLLEEALQKSSEAAFPETPSGNDAAPKAKSPRGKTSGRSGAKQG